MPSTDGEYDVVLFGATGFTGRRTAEYLARHAPPGFRWAIAGRSRAKLEAERARLVGLSARGEDVGIVEARVEDDASLLRMAAGTRVLLSTAGPFIDYGEPVVRACIESGTDYADSTGEAAFVASLLARHGERARERGVRVVPSAGFDAVIADLGALFTLRRLPKDRPIRLSGFVSLTTTFSGGTERSAIKSLAASPPSPRVSPAKGRRVREEPTKVRYVRELGRWAAPFPTIDASVVVRSAASLEEYGPDFGYSHHALHRSLLELAVAVVFFGMVALLARLAVFRALFLAVAKKPGEGPTDAQIAAGSFRMHFIAECDGRTTRTEVSGGDPAYGETAKMLAEAALCLALDRALLAPRAGVLTPAEAMGDVLLARLSGAGIRFTEL